ncbi:YXWGXW repeat-containing protein [Acidomonas methanolica]|uniref:YXWGXW repeat-containing protein n=1 Tax=Acidomonas methanolica TaxID=437 RepID=UPI0038CD53ED
MVRYLRSLTGLPISDTEAFRTSARGKTWRGADISLILPSGGICRAFDGMRSGYIIKNTQYRAACPIVLRPRRCHGSHNNAIIRTRSSGYDPLEVKKEIHRIMRLTLIVFCLLSLFLPIRQAEARPFFHRGLPAVVVRRPPPPPRFVVRPPPLPPAMIWRPAPPPPPPRYEMVPVIRPGFFWEPGRWFWNGTAYIWRPGWMRQY